MAALQLPLWLGLVLLTRCGVMGPPSQAQYPSLSMPTRLPPAAAARARAGSPASTVAAAPREPARAARGESSERIGLSPAAATEAASTESGDEVARHGYLPDPPALSQRAQWVYRLNYDRGALDVSTPTFECRERAVSSPRRIGRFAFELWRGRELIERIRFDFPLLASEDPRPTEGRAPLREAPSFARGARVSVTLSVPASDRANRAQLLDRATGEVVPVPWPPPTTDSDEPGCAQPS